MKAWSYPAFCQRFKLLVVGWLGGFFFYTLSPLVLNEHYLKTKTYLSTLADHLPTVQCTHLLMADHLRSSQII